VLGSHNNGFPPPDKRASSVKTILSWLRPWLVPVALVILAIVLPVPWTLLVLRAAYKRDVRENAQSLARRVEYQRVMTFRAMRNVYGSVDPWSFGDEVIDQQMADSLRAELRSDPSVQSVVFYTVGYDESTKPPTPDRVRVIGILRSVGSHEPLKREQVEQLKKGPIVNDKGATHEFYIPFMTKDGRVAGVTYVALSSERLWAEFWKKEVPLLKQVIAWTAMAVLALSGVGLFAYHSWQKAGHVRERAELARQGMMAERGLTAAVLAHEIRNPLQALRFQLHSLRKNSEDPQRVNGTAQTIDSELMRIQQLVTDYLEHEKAITLRVQRVDLLDAARSLKTVMDELLRQSDTKLTIEGPRDGEPVVALCDPHALRQVLMNLVLNAQQAMQASGRGGQIVIRIGHEEPFGIIDVADTGPGIPQEMRERLFKPFQTSKKEGHGIGLALVKRFVDNFGGNVTVDSEVGRGTTFHLRLPLSGHNELLGDAGVGMVMAAPAPVVEAGPAKAPVPVEPILAGEVDSHPADRPTRV
jgi:signal transduction histidine kinase